MNPQSISTASALRRTLLVFAVICALLSPESGRAQSPSVTASLVGSNGSSTVNITRNQSFTLSLIITTTFPSSGITYFFQSNAAGSGFFRIVARDTTGSPYPAPPLVCSGDACLLNPVNDFDLGETTKGSTAVPPGTYTIATFTFNTENAPVGQYTISTDRGVITDRTGGGFQDRVFAASATINVIPEPGSVGLALVGGAGLLVMLWRKQSGA